MSFIVRGLSKFVKRWPIAVQAFQAGSLMGVGDVIAQTVVEKRKLGELDLKRTLQFASVGFLVVGPPLRVWYGVLDKMVPGKTGMTAVKKMALDQFTFAPFFIVVVMGSIGLSQGQPIQEVRTRLTHDYFDVLLTNYKIWPAVQLINFHLVPLHYQVLTVQFVAIFWNTYLSWKSNRQLAVSPTLR